MSFKDSSAILLCDVQLHLAKALESLEGKQKAGLKDSFLVFSSVHINWAADGYIVLRRASRCDSSRLLIRPVIEAMIRIEAVRKQPDLLYRIAYKESQEDRQLVRGSAAAVLEFDKSWADFTSAYSAQFPNHKRVKAELSAFDAAKIAGVEGYYQSAYRLYCQFTHGAMRTATRSLDTSDLDDRTMAICTFSALNAVASVGAEAPNLSALWSSIQNLYSQDAPEP